MAWVPIHNPIVSPFPDTSWMSLVGQEEFRFMPSEDTAAEKMEALVNWRDTFYKESRSLDILFDGVWNHEDVNLVLWMMIEAGPIKGLRLTGSLGKLILKNYPTNPWVRGFVNRTVTKMVKAFGEKGVKEKFARVIESARKGRRAKRAAYVTTAATTGAQIGSAAYRADMWEARLSFDIKDLLPDYRPDFRDIERMVRNALEEEGDDMPYNRRTGQWYPARRRYGSTGGYRSGYRSGGYRSGGYRRSGTGYGNYSQRRRTYRRW